MIKEKYLYKQALQESSRLDNIATANRLGHEIAEEDMECLIMEDSLTQLNNIHAEFYHIF